MRARDSIDCLRRLYHDVDGFSIPPGDIRTVTRSNGSPTYGELMPTATVRMLEWLELTRRDQFFDLGAGVGKVVLLAALTTSVRRAVGVELSASRVAVGQRAFAAAAREHPEAGRATLIEADMLRCSLEGATVVYTCSTAFSSAFMRRLVRRLATLPRLRVVVSLQELEEHRAFKPIAKLRLDASWKRATKVHVYARDR